MLAPELYLSCTHRLLLDSFYLFFLLLQARTVQQPTMAAARPVLLAATKAALACPRALSALVAPTLRPAHPTASPALPAPTPELRDLVSASHGEHQFGFCWKQAVLWCRSGCELDACVYGISNTSSF